MTMVRAKNDFDTRGCAQKAFMLAVVCMLLSCASDRHAPEVDYDYYADDHEWIRKEKDREEQRLMSIYEKDKLYYEKHDELITDTKSEFNSIIDQLPDDEPAYKNSLLGGNTIEQAEQGTTTVYPCYSNKALAALDGCDQDKLDKLIATLETAEVRQIRVVGHTNNVRLGGAAAKEFGDNQGLSAARAQAVATYLGRKLNLAGDKINASGVGDTQPIASNDTADGRRRNRRVEIHFDYLQSQQLKGVSFNFSGVPAGFNGWWEGEVVKNISEQSSPLYADLNNLYERAIRHSSQISVFSDIPLIRETGILEAEGEFDPRAFVESRIGEKNEPVGSTLRTGGANRFREEEWRVEGGVRKKFWSGAEAEISQRVGGLDTNSSFFQPDDQGLTELAISVTQPLWNGAGAEYTRSTVALAKLDHSISQDEFQRQVESHLLEVARSYWSLYYERANLLIKKRLVTKAELLVKELESRRSIDILESHLARAKAALAARKAEVLRSSQAVRNSEAKVVALLNDPELRLNQAFELVPSLNPSVNHRQISMREAARHALENRPEIQQAMKQIKAAMIRTKMAENEMLPVLDFVMETSWNGLETDFAIDDALGDQFKGTNYFFGLNFEIPIGNREAKARYQRRRIEVRQLTNQMRTTIQTLLLEVQVAVRELDTAKRELDAKYATMQATTTQLEAMQKRRDVAQARGEAASSYLERLLTTQERLADEENGFVNSQLNYNVALVNLDRAMGILMHTQKVSMRREQPEDYLPSIRLDR
ncbi:MAG: TolC family protein [Pseudomonadota bacterium]